MDMTLFLRGVRLERERIRSIGYPYTLPIFQTLDELSFHHPVTFLVGENGSGKSTLIEGMAVAAGFNPEGGAPSFQFETESTHSSLFEALRPIRGPYRPKDGFFLRAETAYQLSSYVDEMAKSGRDPERFYESYGGRSLHEQSHGEAFLSLMLHRFRGDGLYILDEPEAALSPMRQLTMLARMHELVQSGSQFIIASHSPILMSYPGAMILQVETGLTPTAFDDLEHVKVMRDYLDAPERMQRVLFDE
ncbi:AAA family ATPase [Exiguobacterium sp. s189]|uniref:AAA family ATPase n=1 Tax=Exiguobacterium sp. s189 TaxID=2751263 RepID=UPI001BEADDE4|nr:AAA family ATPase [Exiguobacterium sp. s189]